MDSFLQEISEKLRQQTEEAFSTFEQDQKQLQVKCLSCAVDCFNAPGPLRDAEKCADRCYGPMEQCQSQLRQSVGYLQNTLQSCIQSCGQENNQNFSDSMKQCITGCADQCSSMIEDMKEESKQIFKAYL